MSAISINTLISQTLSGQADAWTELAGRVHEAVLSSCGALRLQEGLTFLAGDELAREVAVRVLDRLRASDHRALATFASVANRYRAASPELDDEQHFARWLAVVTKRLRIDYLRSLPEYQRARDRDGGQRIMNQVGLAALSDQDQPSTANAAHCSADRAEVRRILKVLAHADFPAQQRHALVLWLKGYDASEVAVQLGLANKEEATRLLRAARQRLRRNVAGGTKLRAIEGGRR